MPKLYVIAGHGAGDPGAGGGGYNEADLVRKLAAKMKEIGGSEVEVLDTSRNWYADNGVNAALKAKVGTAPLLELHMDAASASAKGGHVIIKSGFNADAYDTALADFISSEFPGRAEKIVKRSNLSNPYRAAAHGINYRLVEVCFITNDADRAKFIKDMDNIARGILGCFGIGPSGTADGAGWRQDSRGWWWRDADGSYPISEWRDIGGIWYWFNDDGYAAQGECLRIGYKWYAFDSDCHMLTSVAVGSSGELIL